MDINFPPQNNQPDSQPASPETPALGPTENKPGSKTLFIVTIVAILVIGASVLTYIYLFYQQPIVSVFVPTARNNSGGEQAATPAEDTTASIGQQLDNIKINDVDSQFKDIDADLNKL